MLNKKGLGEDVIEIIRANTDSFDPESILDLSIESFNRDGWYGAHEPGKKPLGVIYQGLLNKVLSPLDDARDTARLIKEVKDRALRVLLIRTRNTQTYKGVESRKSVDPLIFGTLRPGDDSLSLTYSFTGDGPRGSYSLRRQEGVGWISTTAKTVTRTTIATDVDLRYRRQQVSRGGYPSLEDVLGGTYLTRETLTTPSVETLEISKFYMWQIKPDSSGST